MPPEAIAANSPFPLVTICDVLNICHSAYYDWLTRNPGMRQQALTLLIPIIVSIFRHHPRRYETRRISEELWDHGIVCSPKRVAIALKNQGLRAIQPKSFVPQTTDSRHPFGYSPNLLLGAPYPVHINELWVGDITYLPLKGGGFCYLAALMDRCSRNILV